MEPRRHADAVLELPSNRGWQDVVQQALRFLPLRSDLLSRLIERKQVPPQVHLRYDRMRQLSDRLALLEADFAFVKIEHAQSAEDVTLGINQRHAAIDAQIGSAGDAGQMGKARVL